MPKLSTAQWINIGIFALSSLAMTGWWQSFYTPEHAVAVSGGLLWISSLMNFVFTGKPLDPVVPK